jgi:hypothetical protein
MVAFTRTNDSTDGSRYRLCWSAAGVLPFMGWRSAEVRGKLLPGTNTEVGYVCHIFSWLARIWKNTYSTFVHKFCPSSDPGVDMLGSKQLVTACHRMTSHDKDQEKESGRLTTMRLHKYYIYCLDRPPQRHFQGAAARLVTQPD